MPLTARICGRSSVEITRLGNGSVSFSLATASISFEYVYAASMVKPCDSRFSTRICSA